MTFPRTLRGQLEGILIRRKRKAWQVSSYLEIRRLRQTAGPLTGPISLSLYLASLASQKLKEGTIPMFPPELNSPAWLVLRSRLNLHDVTILVAIILAAALFTFEFQFFEQADRLSAREKRITVAEYFSLTGLLIVSLIVFSFRRLQAQKREFKRRLAAELVAIQARSEALRDLLTGLPNRRALYETVDDIFRQAPHRGVSHALVMLDLNGFKGINDRHGHPVGDKLLVEIGRRLRLVSGANTLAARLGGDEFVVFMPNVEKTEDVERHVSKLIAAIEQPFETGGTVHEVGAAAGIAYFPQDGRNREDLMRHADLALYGAKSEKGSAVRSYKGDRGRAA
jgi:diguanylate cyclase (GGDEF)-like protein